MCVNVNIGTTQPDQSMRCLLTECSGYPRIYREGTDQSVWMYKQMPYGTHYENRPIQIYRKFHLQKLIFFR